MSKEIKRAAIYIRVSTEGQAQDGYSLAAQEHRLRQHCILNSWDVVEMYADEGISGSTIKQRAALTRMLADAKTDKFDIILFIDVSRVARKLTDLLSIVNDLKANDVAFRSIMEPHFDTSTAVGVYLLPDAGATSEFERAHLIQNVRYGMGQRAREGGWNGREPYGYRSVSKSLEIVPGDAAVVRRIFILAGEGKGAWAIANRLNADGLRTRPAVKKMKADGQCTPEGAPFSPAMIRGILENPAYIGLVRYCANEDGKKAKPKAKEIILVQGKHEALIDRDLWDRVQAIRTARAGRPKRLCDREFPLTSLLRCPSCGAGMVMSRTNARLADGTVYAHHYYVCGRTRRMGKSVCQWKGIRADAVERAVSYR